MQGAKSDPRITLDMLDLFVRAARFGTISAAAREKSILASVATRQIASLESALQTQLLTRTSRRTYLTKSGEVTLEWAESVLDGHRYLAGEISALYGKPSGLLRIIVNEYISSMILPRFLKEFTENYPNIQFNLTITDKLVDANQRDYDCAIHVGAVPDSALRGTRIHDISRLLCASPQYLDKYGTPSSVADLHNHRFVLHEQNGRSPWLQVDGERLDLRVDQQVVKADSYPPLIELVRHGLGVGYISLEAIHNDLDQGTMVKLLPNKRIDISGNETISVWIIYPDKRRIKSLDLFIRDFTRFYLERVPSS